jgi:predicted flap endonuclease-1-like 5' DNA nuclease
MAQKKNNESLEDFPPGIGKPATRALHGAGYTRLEQLTKVGEVDLLKLHGVGPKAMRLLREALQAQGRSFADPGKGEGGR